MGEDRNNAFVFRLNDHGGSGPDMLRQVFLEKGWMEFEEDEQDEADWNLWWRTSRFRNSDYDQLTPWQKLNHYPMSTAITRKDSLARNMKRMRAVYGPSVYNFSPNAFNLPNDYTKFVAEYTKDKEKHPNRASLWICKPADMSRGRGIFIFKDLSELQYDCNAVVQSYITNPLQISSYKFDLRIYVLVPSFHPLHIYIYEEGLVRFGTEKYDLSCLGNLYSHLTNTSINKHSPTYKLDKERVGPGCKWTLTQLRHYFHCNNVDDDLLFKRIVYIVILTLTIQANSVPKSENCFELYGFDIIIDESLKPWLLEVNFSPALTADCQTDVTVKKPMLHDLIDILNFQVNDLDRGNSKRSRQHLADRDRDRIPGLVPGTVVNRSGRTLTYSGRSTGSRSRSSYLSVNNKLPHISSPNMRGSIHSSQSSHKYEEEDDDDSHRVAPIIPGCGLPSVQQPPESRPASSSSGCSSAGSVHSVDSAEEDPRTRPLGLRNTRGAQENILRRTSSWRRGLMQNRRSVGTKDQSKRWIQGRSLQESKVVITSDSAISSNSGSSENSEDSHNIIRRRGSSGIPEIRVATLRHTKSQGDLQPGFKPDSRSFTPLRERNETLLTTQTRQRETRKKQISFPANPLVRKSSLVQRKLSFTSGKLTSRPPRPERHRGPQPRCGDFVLVFPLSDVTRKYTRDLDPRVVIKECQKFIKAGGDGKQELPSIWGKLKAPGSKPSPVR